MAEFSAGLQTGKREKVCDFAFLTSSGGKFYKFFMTIALSIPTLTVQNGGGGGGGGCAYLGPCA